jgi:hypothetical protein
VCFDFLYNFCLEHFWFQEELSEIWSKMWIRLHVKYPLLLYISDCCHISVKLLFSPLISEKPSNIKWYENPSSGSRVVPCGRTDIHDEANSRFEQFLRTRLKDNLLHPVNSLKVGTILYGCWLDLKTSININPQHYVKRSMYVLQIVDSLMAVT